MTVSGSATTVAVSVGTSAVALVDGTGLRKSLLVQNVHATNDLYYGYTASVTTSTGVRLKAGESRIWEDYNGPVWGIASGASTDVRVDEVG